MAETFRKEIVQHITRNLLDVQILRLIQAEPMWGYKIKNQVKAKFDVRLRHATLYTMLNTLQRKGFLTSEKHHEGGRIRKVYTITMKGRQYLKAYNDILKEQIGNPYIK